MANLPAKGVPAINRTSLTTNGQTDRNVQSNMPLFGNDPNYEANATAISQSFL